MRFGLFILHIVCTFASYGQCGKVIKVQDGDTFVLLLPNDRKLRVRLAFVDAPEHGQEFGDESKSYLQRLILDKKVCLTIQYKDVYGRSVALANLSNGLLLNEEMLKKGMAWHYVHYSNDKHLQSLEKEARKTQLGLWAHQEPTAPWIWRKEHHIGRTHHHAQ